MVKRQMFTAESKLEAVRQMRAGSKPTAQLSRELGIPRSRLYKWSQTVQVHGEQAALPGSGWRSAVGGASRADAVARCVGAGRAGVRDPRKAEAYFAETPTSDTSGSKRSKRPVRCACCVVPRACRKVASMHGNTECLAHASRLTRGWRWRSKPCTRSIGSRMACVVSGACRLIAASHAGRIALRACGVGMA